MTYTTPPTKSAGQNLTVADWNTSIVANMEALAKPPACLAVRTSGATFSTGDPITFPAEEFDTHSLHDTTTNTSRITVPAGWAGIWLITASSIVAGNRIRINGSTIAAEGAYGATALVSLAVGDYAEVTVTTAASSVTGQMSAIWLRAAP